MDGGVEGLSKKKQKTEEAAKQEAGDPGKIGAPTVCMDSNVFCLSSVFLFSD